MQEIDETDPGSAVADVVADYSPDERRDRVL
jgi:hypothetical protein